MPPNPFYITFVPEERAMTPNWQHNSGKCKKTKGMCKGKIKSLKQALQALKLKLLK